MRSYRGSQTLVPNLTVLLVNNFYCLKGGPEVVMCQEGEGLRRRGHKVIPFAAQDESNLPSPWSDYFAPAMALDADAIGLWNGARTAGRFVWNRPAALAARRLLQDLRPDVAHAHNVYHQLSPSVLRELARGVRAERLLGSHRSCVSGYVCR